MKKYIFSLPILLLIVIITACTGQGYKINGIAKEKSFEGKTVYLKDPYDESKVYDSVIIKQGKFAFSDTADITIPHLRLLTLHTSEGALEYRLPIAIENGNIQAELGDIVCTSGTDLNDKLQDFLLGITDLSSSIAKEQGWTPEKIKARFSEFLIGSISTNANNIVGVYIYKAYVSSLDEEAAKSLLNKYSWLKKQVEN